jgi:hypothetical protein
MLCTERRTKSRKPATVSVAHHLQKPLDFTSRGEFMKTEYSVLKRRRTRLGKVINMKNIYVNAVDVTKNIHKGGIRMIVF